MPNLWRKAVKKFLIAAILAFSWAAPACAIGAIADITIYDRAENRALPVYAHEGRYYVVGRPGNEYQVHVRNNQAGDILTVVSVDGVNAVSGETANWRQTGYVLGAYNSFGIRGWRKSTRNIAAFYFTELENSYAARTGRPDNVGVIGVAMFRRKVEPAVGILRDELRRNAAPPASAAHGKLESAERDAARDTASSVGEAQSSSAPGRADAAPRPQVVPQPVEKFLGTGHGKIETSVVSYARFERASQTPDDVITIYYDSYRNLVAKGVIADAPRIARPSPFPWQFVPDPR